MSNKPIAVAVYSTVDGDLYSMEIFSTEEITQLRSFEHPEIGEDSRVVIVYPNLCTEHHT